MVHVCGFGRSNSRSLPTIPITIKVRHYPPGTSKWNKIEHRLFCHITQNRRGRPLTDHATIIDLIASTSTKTGLKVEAVLDTTVYEKGIKIANAEMKHLNIRGDAFHPEWNYIIIPQLAVIFAGVFNI
jgi:Rhodopirellula transposase DDE domain